jgi:hypothetical protein
MIKNLSSYTLNTKANIVNRASDISDIVSGSSYVEVTNIELDDIATIMGKSDSKLDYLHDDASVNSWSAFGPVRRSCNYNTWIVERKTPAEIGNFAGYNHNAITPNIVQNGNVSVDMWEGQTRIRDFNVTVNMGEINWPAITGGYGVVYRVLNESNVIMGESATSDYRLHYTNPTGHNVTMNTVIEDVSIPGYSQSYNAWKVIAYARNGAKSVPLQWNYADLDVSLHFINMGGNPDQPSYGGDVYYNACSVTGSMSALSALWTDVSLYTRVKIEWNGLTLQGGMGDCSLGGECPGYTEAPEGNYNGCYRVAASIFDASDNRQEYIDDIYHGCIYDGSDPYPKSVLTDWDLGKLNYSDYVKVSIFLEDAPNPCGCQTCPSTN